MGNRPHLHLAEGQGASFASLSLCQSTLKVSKEVTAPCDTGHHSKYKPCSWQHGNQLTAKFIPFIPTVSTLAE